ncbi:MAG: Glycogen synthase [Elusimicrobia bacterium ADurb.Bin231]|nr:MAG: Glycogen synthase [Elusimicrobia bacterium ADurb.Bin231]
MNRSVVSKKMNVLIASTECVPFAKVGGLADVCGSLGKFLPSEQINLRVIMPLYKTIDKKKFGLKKIAGNFIIPMAGKYIETSVWQTKKEGFIVYFVQNDLYFDRDNIYGTPEGDYPDQAERFIFFSKAVLETAKFVDFKPDVIHCNDWQTAIIPAYLKTVYKIDAFFASTKSVFTVHNMAYQGLFEKDIYNLAGFSDMDFIPDRLEFYGKFNFMKAGIVYADKISTVSPSYAEEIRTNNFFGHGLENLLELRKSDLSGILNGIDCQYWNPEKDPLLKKKYSVDKLRLKKENKKYLLASVGLKNIDQPLFGMVSRLEAQKGFDLLLEILPELLKKRLSLVILGKGAQKFQKDLIEISKKYPENLSVNIAFDESLAHNIYAGADVFMMPSLFEPCGLGQIIAMRYGTVPLVTKTGGFKDTVDETCGFFIENADPLGMLTAADRVIAAYHVRKTWDKRVRQCMKKDFCWKKSVIEYVKLFKSAIK